MSAELNKEVVRRYYEEVLNGRDVGALDEIAVADYVEHDPLPGQGTGRDGLTQRVSMLQAALAPHFQVEDVVAEGDKVMVRWINSGTHVGEFFGVPPTQKSFTFAGIDIHLLRDGKLAEHWHVIDQLTLLQQLGLVPQGGAT